MNVSSNNIPSMKNVYDSTYWNKIKHDEQELSNDLYKKSRKPCETGIVSKNATSDTFKRNFYSEINNDDDIIGPNDLNIILKKYNAGDKVIIKYLRDNKIKTSELTLGSYKGSTFTQLENERGKDFTDITNNINIPLKNIEPMIQPKL